MGDFMSHAVAVCTPRQQQQLQQHVQKEVEEKARAGVIGNEGKHVLTYRDKSQPPAVCTLPGGLLGGASPRGIVDACIVLLDN